MFKLPSDDWFIERSDDLMNDHKIVVSRRVTIRHKASGRTMTIIYNYRHDDYEVFTGWDMHLFTVQIPKHLLNKCIRDVMVQMPYGP